MKEIDLQRDIINYLNSLSVYNFKINGASLKGVPDIFLVYKKIPIFLKTKGSIGILNKNQREQINNLKMNKIKVFVVYDLKEVENILMDINESHNT